jgi:hypothetical protein
MEPLFEAARPRLIVEVGAGQGRTTEKLLEFAAANGSVVHVIDPEPEQGFEPEQLKREHGERFVFHRMTSHDALRSVPELDEMDVVLIDGDHNWYTVYNELKLLAERTVARGRSFPLTLLHDVDWPYGRRDQYYGPERIPVEHRQPYRAGGLAPNMPEPDGTRGISVGLHHAIAEGGPRNGVLTAVEDFLKDSDLPLRSTHVAGFHGLMILFPERRTGENELVHEVLDAIGSPEWLYSWCQRIERGRVHQLVMFIEMRRALRKAR